MFPLFLGLLSKALLKYIFNFSSHSLFIFVWTSTILVVVLDFEHTYLLLPLFTAPTNLIILIIILIRILMVCMVSKVCTSISNAKFKTKTLTLVRNIRQLGFVAIVRVILTLSYWILGYEIIDSRLKVVALSSSRGVFLNIFHGL